MNHMKVIAYKTQKVKRYDIISFILLRYYKEEKYLTFFCNFHSFYT